MRRGIRGPALATGVLAAVVAGCMSTPAPLPSPTAAAAPAPAGPRAVTVRVVGPGGNVGDAMVCATRTGGEERCATSGADGRAAVEIVPGTYSVRATPARGKRLAEGVAIVDLSQDVSAVVTVEGLATISGIVRDEGAKGQPDAKVCAHAATSTDVKCARTRADGTYTVEVRPGAHKVEVTGPAGSRLIPQWARGRIGSFEADIVDTRTADAAGLDLVLVRGVVLSGVVTAAGGGTSVKEAQVCTYPLSAPLGWDCELTDKSGRYALLREPGRYWVWTIPPGERGSRLMYQRYDRVLEGVDATPFDLFKDAKLDVALTEGAVLRGRVTTPDGKPVVLASVCLDTPFPTGRICRQTGDDGIYEIGTRPQTYVVSVSPPDGGDLIGGFWPDSQPDWTRAGEVRVGSGGAVLDIAVPRGVRFTGTVRDARGVPVEGATVNVNDASGPVFFGSTDLQGRYSIAVKPGTYTVDVFAPRWPSLVSVLGQRIDLTSEAAYDVALPDGPED